MRLLSLMRVLMLHTAECGTTILHKGRSLLYKTTEPISGMQFNHNGCVLTTDNTDHKMDSLQTSEKVAILFDMKGGIIQPGSGVLLQVSDDCDITNMVLSTRQGTALDHTLEKSTD